ncbi:lipopolysaccharide biosynthesis protein [Maribacter sp. 2307ULW6-5]|uniref:lipopolysaccharide biosynthesis protein n=1 Tax=Maribacter sp. 2307ULW6-5 TaxID=3386275 RepID=UPI0039BC94D8
MKNKIYKKLGVSSDRTQNIANHIGWSTVFKMGSILTNFLLVPITIDYLDTENYGVWLTLSSFIAWFSFFDIGLGNGLRNKFGEAKALGKFDDAQAFVSTAYYTIGSISMLLLFVFLFLNPFINWAQLFNTKAGLQEDLSILLPIVFVFFALQLVAKLITTIYQADQNHSIQGKVQFYTQAISLLVIWLLTKTDKSSLLIFGSVFSALPVLILLGLNVFAFKQKYKRFKPKFSLWNKHYLKEITGLGFKFFVVQIAAIVLFSTDNLIISKLFGPEEVVPYNIAFKFFSIVTMGYTILIAPFWSSFTEAYAKKDFAWIKNAVANIQKIWLLVPVGLIGMILIANWFYDLWVGEKVDVPLYLSMAMALFVALSTFNMIYVNFINGVGKIKLQLITSLVSMTINIPLSIYLGKYLGWGSTGVILATCFSLGYSVVLRPLQYHKIINNTATGIWNK